MKSTIQYVAIVSLCLSINHAAAQVQKKIRRDGQLKPKKSFIPDEGVDVPMKMRGTMPGVQVMVNGKGPYFFAIDTGGMGLCRADSTLVKKLGLSVVSQVQASDGSGKNFRTLDVIGIDEITVGDAKFSGLTGPSRDYNSRARPGVANIDGILCIHLFSECLLTLDYVNKRVLIRKGSLPPADGKEILELVSSQQTGMPTVEIKVGEQKSKAHIDSGNMAGGLIVSTKLKEKLNFSTKPKVVGEGRTVTNRVKIEQGILNGSVFIGKHEFKNPAVASVNLFRDSNIGSQWLKHFKITFDLKNQRVRFERKETGPIEAKSRPRLGIAFGTRGNSLFVARVFEGSAAKQAGLLANDEVLKINGTEVASLSPDEMRKILTTAKSIEFDILRDGKNVTVTVKLQ